LMHPLPPFTPLGPRLDFGGFEDARVGDVPGPFVAPGSRALVAQWIEHRFPKPGVAGPIPAEGTTCFV
jgi:hypothetical protein